MKARTTTHALPQSFSFGLQPAVGWSIILGFVVFTALCLATGLSQLLNLAFPAGALLVGVLLYIRYPILYNGFSWWMWFLTPFVRRLVDQKIGFMFWVLCLIMLTYLAKTKLQHSQIDCEQRVWGRCPHAGVEPLHPVQIRSRIAVSLNSIKLERQV
ncbi:hypothetical protein [Leptolyngbya sp. 7M]|uniref:hypothetical protein n=1 Tax=Leptolyngbya sp. 7M TaxID=2812896 RepID=UPI001B8A9652|nr:hypothetical protein [Leptolyngbya sp. 7M]QYO62553.1 hypothetical protein JVX88_21135 [Leptolyngbya sp. 7M]